MLFRSGALLAALALLLNGQPAMLAAILLLGQQFAALGSGLVAGGGLGLTDWLVIAAIPFGGVALATLTARLTVIAALRKIL